MDFIKPIITSVPNNSSEQPPPVQPTQQPQAPVQLAPQEPKAINKMGSHNEYNPSDTELEELLATQKATIKVVGCGGGGNNTINRITEVGIKGAATVAISLDAIILQI